MTEEMTHCDMCGCKIENNRCSCGKWKSAQENKHNPFKLSLEEFHKMEQLTLTCDAPHLGVGVVFFRGDYVDCKDIEQYILNRKNRPYYH